MGYEEFCASNMPINHALTLTFRQNKLHTPLPGMRILFSFQSSRLFSFSFFVGLFFPAQNCEKTGQASVHHGLTEGWLQKVKASNLRYFLEWIPPGFLVSDKVHGRNMFDFLFWHHLKMN